MLDDFSVTVILAVVIGMALLRHIRNLVGRLFLAYVFFDWVHLRHPETMVAVRIVYTQVRAAVVSVASKAAASLHDHADQPHTGESL